MDIGPVEMRVLGSLIEKQRTTPDVYPLTLNALRLACNQSTNRDPVLSLDDGEIRAALDRLAQKRWARMASGQGSRAPKYRHLLSETLGVGAGELSVLAVLMLRGPQTPGELKARGDRLHHFEDLEAVQATLERLTERGHVRVLERGPGQKEERYAQLLGDVGAGEAATSAPEEPRPASAPDPALATQASDGTAARLDRLEREVASLRSALESLERELGTSA
jgi:uncharacterized protein